MRHRISLLLGHNPTLYVRLELFSERRRKLEQWRPDRLRSWSSHRQLGRHCGGVVVVPLEQMLEEQEDSEELQFYFISF